MVGTEALSIRMDKQLKGALLGEDGRMKKNHRLTVLRFPTKRKTVIKMKFTSTNHLVPEALGSVAKRKGQEISSLAQRRVVPDPTLNPGSFSEERH